MALGALHQAPFGTNSTRTAAGLNYERGSKKKNKRFAESLTLAIVGNVTAQRSKWTISFDQQRRNTRYERNCITGAEVGGNETPLSAIEANVGGYGPSIDGDGVCIDTERS
jgi:hypothetical protein